MLEVVDDHLSDDRLHIVAAPGAGKTTLGLEVFRRLGKPALVLAPTLTIRDQWIQRLEDFEPTPERGVASATWTSVDLGAPGFLTAVTYQAVLSRSRAGGDRAPSSDDERSLSTLLRDAQVGTLILDEAHHLKRAWWRALDRVVSEVEGLQLVSLTGTPPYDATGQDWRRYEELCGPIDEEISVPELVRARTLCPHQDFVFAVAPSESEWASVREHDAAVDAALSDLLDDPRFQQDVDGHPWLSDEVPLEDVLGAPEVAVSLLAYLRATGAGAPPPLLAVLDLTASDVPPLDRRWWSALLDEYLHGGSFGEELRYRVDVAAVLRARGLLWRRSLRLVRAAPVERSLALSREKVRACVEINALERAVRRDSLRQVILLDYIRDDDIDAPPAANPELGAFPVFDALRSEDVALLTGRVAAIHESRVSALSEALGTQTCQTTPLLHRPGWLRLSGVPTGRLVAAFTELLSQGVLRSMVGTRSLLGEGWDAPSVNSVILCSYVGAYVGTNQMRGRAIRSDPTLRKKVSSVWHLVAVAPGTSTGFLDMEQLRARFRTFVGLSADGRTIGSGIDRLALPELAEARDLDDFNAESSARLRRLPQVVVAWQAAIETAEAGRVVPTVSFRSPPTFRPLQVTRTLRYVLMELSWSSAFALGGLLRAAGSGAGALIMAGATLPMLVLAPRLFKAGRLTLMHAPIDGSVRYIGRAVLEALQHEGRVSAEGVSVRTGRSADGGVHVSLEGGNFHDQSTFADAVGEVLGPVGNPRYLITRPVRLLGRTRIDFHAVPTVLGAKRGSANTFLDSWLKYVGVGELVYTRRDGGRAALLAARGRTFANQFEDPVERIDRWQ